MVKNLLQLASGFYVSLNGHSKYCSNNFWQPNRLHFVLFLVEFPTSPWQVSHSPEGHDIRMRSTLRCTRSSCGVAVEGKKTFCCRHQDFSYPLTGGASIAQITWSSSIAYISCYSLWSSPQVYYKSCTSHKAKIYAWVRHCAAQALL